MLKQQAEPFACIPGKFTGKSICLHVFMFLIVLVKDEFMEGAV